MDLVLLANTNYKALHYAVFSTLVSLHMFLGPKDLPKQHLVTVLLRWPGSRPRLTDGMPRGPY
jgi:hypothetical protein